MEQFDDSLGKAVMLTSTERMTQALDMLRRWEQWTWQDAYDFVTVGVWHEDTQRKLMGMLKKAESLGAPSPKQGFKNLDIELRIAIATSFHVVDHAGGITGLGSMVFVPDRGPRSWRLYDKNSESILTANFKEGQFGRISGIPGTGKTNTGCVIMEEWVKNEKRTAFTNIKPKHPLKEFPDSRIVYVKDAKAFFLALSHIQEGTTWILVLDEAGLIYSRPDQTTRRVKDLDKFMRIARHLHGSILLIEQRIESVPSIIQEFSVCLFYCEHPGVLNIELKGPTLAFRDRVKDFPRTSLPFDTYDIAYLEINVDLQRMFASLAGAEKPMEVLKDFIENERWKESKKEIKLCAHCGIKPLGPGAHRFCEDCQTLGQYERRLEKQSTKKKDDLDTFLKDENVDRDNPG